MLAVEQVIGEIPEVEAVSVITVIGPDSQSALVAAVESAIGPTLETVIKASVRQQLGSAAVPCHVLDLPELPLLPNGKVDRATLSEIASQSGRLPWQL